MIQLVRPCRGHITQRYGNIQSDGMKHTGNDYAYYSGGQVMPEVFAAADFEVLYAGDSRALGWPNPWYFNPDFDRNDAVDSSAGNVLVLGHVQNRVPFVTTYSHLEAWNVRKGDTGRAGQHIAKIGNTGRSTGKHLHFELMFKPLNFNTATYGRTDPNPYIIEGLAAQGTINQEDDFMALFKDRKDFEDAIEVVFQRVSEPMHQVTRRDAATNVLKAPVQYTNPTTGQPDGTTTLETMVGNADFQHHQTRLNTDAKTVVANIPDSIAAEVADLLAKRLAK